MDIPKAPEKDAGPRTFEFYLRVLEASFNKALELATTVAELDDLEKRYLGKDGYITIVQADIAEAYKREKALKGAKK